MDRNLTGVSVTGEESRVRLVRACGSKLAGVGGIGGRFLGQARKSLWIETRLAGNRASDFTGSGS